MIIKEPCQRCWQDVLVYAYQSSGNVVIMLCRDCLNKEFDEAESEFKRSEMD